MMTLSSSLIGTARWRVLVLATLLACIQLGCGPADLLEQAKSLQATGHFERSLVPLRALLAEGVNDPEVDLLYGRALQGSGVPMMSIWALRRAMEDPEWFEPAGLLLASGALQAKEYNLAIEISDRLIEEDPDDPSALMIRAMAKVGTRQLYEEAIEDADRVLEIDPDAVKAEVARTIALLALDRVEEASAGLIVAEEYYASDELNQIEASHFCAAQVSFFREKGESEEAGEVLVRCLESYPKSEEIIGQALEYYDEEQQFDRSIEILQKAMEESPDVSDYRVALVLRLDASGRVEEAKALMVEATESDNPAEAAAAFFDLAGYRLSSEDFDGAIEAYEEALELAPRFSSSRLFSFADALIVAGRLDRALEIADQMEVRPHRELVQGRVAYEREDYADALDHFSEGLLLWPDNAVARYLAANSALQVGDVDRAIEEYRYAVRLDAEATDARIELARLYLADGDLNVALQIVRHGGGTPDVESALLDLEIVTRLTRRPVSMPPHLFKFNQIPGFRQQSVKNMAKVVREENSPDASVAFIEDLSLDLTAPKNGPILLELVRSLIQSGRISDASELADRAIRMNPALSGSHVALGLVLESRSDPKANPGAAFDRASELNPANADALSGRARISRAEGKNTEATELYLLAAQSEPFSTDALWSAVEIARSTAQPPELESALEEILERDPYDGAAAFLLAQSRLQQGKNEQALWLARRGVRFAATPESEALLKSLSAPSLDLTKSSSSD